MATQKALVLRQYGTTPKLEDWPVPELAPGQILVELEGSAVNPSDRSLLKGGYFKIPLPNPAGLEGAGIVIKVNGDNFDQWKDKRVCFFTSGGGAWSQYIALDPNTSIIFEIDKDIELASAASGVVNPLTVIGMIHVFNATNGKKGIIHTAAASALGRMLNKKCQRLGIPLLNIVRREEQAELLKKEGAKHVIVTKGNWQDDYKSLIKEHGFNVLFDCLGGGEVQASLVNNLSPNSYVHIYGKLDSNPSVLNKPELETRGVHVAGFYMVEWYNKLPKEEKGFIRKNYSNDLKQDFSTHGFKTLGLEQLQTALELSVSKATEGKITFVPK